MNFPAGGTPWGAENRPLPRSPALLASLHPGLAGLGLALAGLGLAFTWPRPGAGNGSVAGGLSGGSGSVVGPELDGHQGELQDAGPTLARAPEPGGGWGLVRAGDCVLWPLGW